MFGHSVRRALFAQPDSTSRFVSRASCIPNLASCNPHPAVIMNNQNPQTAPLVAAAVQMNSRDDKTANVNRAVELVEEAAERGAKLVALPEFFNCLTHWDELVANAEVIPGPTSERMSALAARLQITLLAGSIGEMGAEPRRAYNTSLLFGPDGQLLSRYRKKHLFDVTLPGGLVIQESRHIIPGSESVVTKSAFGYLGQATCYDLRFPEMFRELVDANAQILFLPSAFTRDTGRDHWEILLRARAIENQVFIVAPNQCGQHTAELISYGNSMIVDPWGKILARANASTDEVIVAELDGDFLQQVRARLPSLQHRQQTS